MLATLLVFVERERELVRRKVDVGDDMLKGEKLLMLG
jgi:hypothetical protein